MYIFICTSPKAKILEKKTFLCFVWKKRNPRFLDLHINEREGHFDPQMDEGGMRSKLKWLCYCYDFSFSSAPFFLFLYAVPFLLVLTSHLGPGLWVDVTELETVSLSFSKINDLVLSRWPTPWSAYSDQIGTQWVLQSRSTKNYRLHTPSP